MQPAKLSLSLSRSPADVIVGERIFTDDRPRERPSNALPLYGHLSFRLISRLGGRPFRSPHVHRPEEHPNSVSTHVRSPPPPRIYGVLSKTPPQHPQTSRETCISLWCHSVPPPRTTPGCLVLCEQKGKRKTKKKETRWVLRKNPFFVIGLRFTRSGTRTPCQLPSNVGVYM